MFELPPLPDDLPWTIPAYLLLDGVSVPHLAERLRRWNNPAHCLYQFTRWHEMSYISPYLVSVTGPDDSLLAYYQENAVQEWGYLLFSDAGAHTLCKHWRRLLTVEQSGVEVMLRIADPAVIDPLLALAGQAHSARWFGPVEHLCLPDAFHNSWLQHRRPDPGAPDTANRYRLTDQELTALGEVKFRSAVMALSDHLQTYFPELMARYSGQERRNYAQQIVQHAYRQGFVSEQEITLYANVRCFLAGQSLADHPDIAQLLTVSTAQSPLKRLERAAELAKSRAAHPQGSQP